MFLLQLVLVSLIFLLWLWRRWSQVKKYWAERQVPFEPPHPIMGNLTFLQRENPAIWMKRLYTKFKSPYVGVWLFWRPALVINSPEIARRVLVRDSDNFRNRFMSSGKGDPIGSLNLFAVKDPIWTSVRKRLTPVFTASKLRAMQDLLIKKSDDLIERLTKEIGKGDLIHTRQICTDYTSDVVGESALGISSESTRDGDSVVRRITRELGAFNVHRGLSWSSIFFFPEVVDIFRFKLFPKESCDFLKQIFRTIVERRGGYDKEVKETRDLFDTLLKMKYEAAQNDEEISEDLLVAQAAVFLFGGFDTSGSVFTFTIYELAHNYDAQERLYEELEKTKKQLGDKDFDLKSLAELPYLNAVIKETLRKYPPMGWLDRIAAKEYQIDDNLTISAGSVIYVNAVGMHVDPKYFSEPEVYNPDRFLPGNDKNILPYTFMPFGDGPRSCIGLRFAKQVLRFGIAKVCINFKMEPLPNAPKPHEVQIDKHGLLMMPGEKLSVNLIPRPLLSA